jgi:carbohydrate kinase (thermoresistant glucokinase family)
VQLVVMGVSGCGKSTIGKLIASKYGIEFIDGDDLHPQGNIEKMSQGIPLNDEDRWPWLESIARELNTIGSGVIACSALKRSYRLAILKVAPETLFIHLHGSREVLESRLAARRAHFMPAKLLESQLLTLEELTSDEPGYVVDINKSEIEIVNEISAWIDERNAKLAT